MYSAISQSSRIHCFNVKSLILGFYRRRKTAHIVHQIEFEFF